MQMGETRRIRVPATVAGYHASPSVPTSESIPQYNAMFTPSSLPTFPHIADPFSRGPNEPTDESSNSAFPVAFFLTANLVRAAISPLELHEVGVDRLSSCSGSLSQVQPDA
jgi:hypothetical protein